MHIYASLHVTLVIVCVGDKTSLSRTLGNRLDHNLQILKKIN